MSNARMKTGDIEPSPSLDQLTAEVTRVFQARHGRPPRWVVAAPGRVNLIGEHTDYNDGFVLPMAIDRYAVIAADRPRDAAASPGIHWYCDTTRASAAVRVTPPIEKAEPRWANYIRGVVAGYLARGIEVGPLDVVMHSTVPLGGGLSSSAALEVATATLIEAVSGRALAPREKVLTCQKAEHDFAGMPCGVMDQFASALARPDHLLLLDCRSLEVEYVPMTDPEVTVLIINTNVKHDLGSSEYPKRRAECETAARALGLKALRDADSEALSAARDRLDPVVFRRARHAVSEIERTVQAAVGVRTGNWPTVGQLMYASHLSLRDDYAVSCRELDVLVDAAHGLGLERGMIGCRMTGGGFGGCTVSLVETAAVADVARRMAETYWQKTGKKASLFVTRPAAGATVVRG